MMLEWSNGSLSIKGPDDYYEEGRVDGFNAADDMWRQALLNSGILDSHGVAEFLKEMEKKMAKEDTEKVHTVDRGDWDRPWEWVWEYKVEPQKGFFNRFDVVVYAPGHGLVHGWEGGVPFSAFTLAGAHSKGQRVVAGIRKKQEKQRKRFEAIYNS